MMHGPTNIRYEMFEHQGTLDGKVLSHFSYFSKGQSVLYIGILRPHKPPKHFPKCTAHVADANKGHCSLAWTHTVPNTFKKLEAMTWVSTGSSCTVPHDRLYYEYWWYKPSGYYTAELMNLRADRYRERYTEWTVYTEEQTLLIFERKIFRRIYGPKYENGEWKSWTNR